MSDRDISDGQISFLQLFCNTETIRFNSRLDSVAYIHCDTTLINTEALKIYVQPT